MNITVNGKDLERLQSLVYMGGPYTSDAIMRSEEGSDLQKSTFTSMSKVLISRSIDIVVRMHVLICYIWSLEMILMANKKQV